jgi:hypothetical protein
MVEFISHLIEEINMAKTHPPAELVDSIERGRRVSRTFVNGQPPKLLRPLTKSQIGTIVLSCE